MRFGGGFHQGKEGRIGGFSGKNSDSSLVPGEVKATAKTDLHVDSDEYADRGMHAYKGK